MTKTIESKDKTDALVLTVGIETTSEEMDVVRTAFSENFKVEIDNSYVRLSEGQLPFIVDIAIGLASAGIYDFLKISIKKLLHINEINRKKTIVVRKSDEQYIFSNERICIRKNAEDIEFDSIDDLFNYIQK